MTTVQIPSIEFMNDRIQKCSVVINNDTFNVEYQGDRYVVNKGKSSSSVETPPPTVEPKPVEVAKITSTKTKVAEVAEVAEVTPKVVNPKVVKPKVVKTKVVEKTKEAKVMDELKVRLEQIKEANQKKEEANQKKEEAKYNKYNKMRKTGVSEQAIRQKMTTERIEEKEIDEYFKSQEYTNIKLP